MSQEDLMQLDPDILERFQAEVDPYSMGRVLPTRGDLVRTPPALPCGLDQLLDHDAI